MIEKNPDSVCMSGFFFRLKGDQLMFRPHSSIVQEYTTICHVKPGRFAGPEEILSDYFFFFWWKKITMPFIMIPERISGSAAEMT